MQTDQLWAVDTFIFFTIFAIVDFLGFLGLFKNYPGCFMIKFVYNARCYWLKKRARSKYKE